MADIDIERKSGSSWIWWIVALVVLALVAWWLFARRGPEEVAVAPTPAAVAPGPDTTAVAAPGTAVAAALPVAPILANPAEWKGRTVSGSGRVGEVPTDRGFWLEGDGTRIFAILDERPAARPADIGTGRTVNLTGATVHADTTGLPGDLDADTRRILSGQAAFLTVPESAVSPAAPGSASTGPMPADTAARADTSAAGRGG